jgi:D-glycero-D-manno-heptose 1,7-bisphosphate phosphatase
MSERALFIGLGKALVDGPARREGPPLVRSAARAFPLLRDAGFSFVVVAHEPSVALGVLSEEDVSRQGQLLGEAMARIGATLGGFYYCPHHPSGIVREYAVDCLCRRPQPGLIIRAASELEIDLPASWAVGDVLDDVEAGRRAGCRTVLVDTGTETEWRVSRYRVPHYLTGDLAKAARVILAAERKSTTGPRTGNRAS